MEIQKKKEEKQRQQQAKMNHSEREEFEEPQNTGNSRISRKKKRIVKIPSIRTKIMVSTVISEKDSCSVSSENCLSNASTRHLDSPLPSRPLRNSQFLGVVLLISVSLPTMVPSLDAIAQQFNLSDDAADFWTNAGANVPYPSEYRCGDGCSAAEEAEAEMHGDRSFNYEHLCSLKVTAVTRDRGGGLEEDEEEEDKGSKKRRRSLRQAVQEQALQHNCIRPADGIYAPSYSSSIGTTSDGNSCISTPCKESESQPQQFSIPSIIGIKGGHAKRESKFGRLPDAVLFALLGFLTFPEVLALLATNKTLSRFVKSYFSVNEHGVFSIPAYAGRPSPVHRYEGTPSTNANTNTSTDSSHSSGKSKSVAKGDSSDDSTASTVTPGKNIRLFFGQQRRDNHPSSLRHLLNFLLPDVAIPHMEAHTNPLNGRGKGCSWVFVTSHEDASRLMGLNKLLFLDVNKKGEEVYLLAPPHSKDWLQQHAQEVSTESFRPNYLPRQPMVVEIPNKFSNKRKKATTAESQAKRSQEQQQQGEQDNKMHGEQKPETKQEHENEVMSEIQVERECFASRDKGRLVATEVLLAKKITPCSPPHSVANTVDENEKTEKVAQVLKPERQPRCHFPLRPKRLSWKYKRSKYYNYDRDSSHYYYYDNNYSSCDYDYSYDYYYNHHSASCLTGWMDPQRGVVVVGANKYRHDPYLPKLLSFPTEH